MSATRRVVWFSVLALGCGGTAKKGPTPVSAVAPPPSPAPAPARVTEPPAGELVRTSAGELRITAVYHATVMFEHAGLVVIVDPKLLGFYSGKRSP
jgi:hypothetical protein